MQMGKIYICAAVPGSGYTCNVPSKYTSRAFVFAVPLHVCTELEMCLLSISCTCVVCCITLQRQRDIHDCMNSVICKYMYALHIGSKSMLPFFF